MKKPTKGIKPQKKKTEKSLKKENIKNSKQQPNTKARHDG